MYDSLEVLSAMGICLAVLLGTIGCASFCLMRRSLTKSISLLGETHRDQLKELTVTLHAMKQENERLDYQVKGLTFANRKLSNEVDILYQRMRDDIPEETMFKSTDLIH